MRLFNGMKLLLLSHTGKASFHLKLGNDGCYAPVKPRKEVLTKEYLFNRWLTVKQLLGFWQNSNCAVLLAAYWMILLLVLDLKKWSIVSRGKSDCWIGTVLSLPLMLDNFHTDILVTVSYCSFQAVFTVSCYKSNVRSSVQQQPQNTHPTSRCCSNQSGALKIELKRK